MLNMFRKKAAVAAATTVPEDEGPVDTQATTNTTTAATFSSNNIDHTQAGFHNTNAPDLITPRMILQHHQSLQNNIINNFPAMDPGQTARPVPPRRNESKGAMLVPSGGIQNTANSDAVSLASTVSNKSRASNGTNVVSRSGTDHSGPSLRSPSTSTPTTMEMPAFPFPRVDSTYEKSVEGPLAENTVGSLPVYVTVTAATSRQDDPETDPVPSSSPPKNKAKTPILPVLQPSPAPSPVPSQPAWQPGQSIVGNSLRSKIENLMSGSNGRSNNNPLIASTSALAHSAKEEIPVVGSATVITFSDSPSEPSSVKVIMATSTTPEPSRNKSPIPAATTTSVSKNNINDDLPTYDDIAITDTINNNPHDSAVIEDITSPGGSVTRTPGKATMKKMVGDLLDSLETLSPNEMQPLPMVPTQPRGPPMPPTPAVAQYVPSQGMTTPPGSTGHSLQNPFPASFNNNMPQQTATRSWADSSFNATPSTLDVPSPYPAKISPQLAPTQMKPSSVVEARKQRQHEEWLKLQHAMGNTNVVQDPTQLTTSSSQPGSQRQISPQPFLQSQPPQQAAYPGANTAVAQGQPAYIIPIANGANLSYKQSLKQSRLDAIFGGQAPKSSNNEQTLSVSESHAYNVQQQNRAYQQQLLQAQQQRQMQQMTQQQSYPQQLPPSNSWHQTQSPNTFDPRNAAGSTSSSPGIMVVQTRSNGGRKVRGRHSADSIPIALPSRNAMMGDDNEPAPRGSLDSMRDGNLGKSHLRGLENEFMNSPTIPSPASASANVAMSLIYRNGGGGNLIRTGSGSSNVSSSGSSNNSGMNPRPVTKSILKKKSNAGNTPQSAPASAAPTSTLSVVNNSNGASRMIWRQRSAETVVPIPVPEPAIVIPSPFKLKGSSSKDKIAPENVFAHKPGFTTTTTYTVGYGGSAETMGYQANQ